mmetsp:Transcript_88870/g.240974  ORF Transcript_88870/g.240974 Transcript_88870/m.240974 type:complete len:215 (-) Transcript_88870:498-1142(-)
MLPRKWRWIVIAAFRRLALRRSVKPRATLWMAMAAFARFRCRTIQARQRAWIRVAALCLACSASLADFLDLMYCRHAACIFMIIVLRSNLDSASCPAPSSTLVRFAFPTAAFSVALSRSCPATAPSPAPRFTLRPFTCTRAGGSSCGFIVEGISETLERRSRPSRPITSSGGGLPARVAAMFDGPKSSTAATEALFGVCSRAASGDAPARAAAA